MGTQDRGLRTGVAIGINTIQLIMLCCLREVEILQRIEIVALQLATIRRPYVFFVPIKPMNALILQTGFQGLILAS